VVRCRPGIVANAEFGTIPEQRCTASLRYALHRIQETPLNKMAELKVEHLEVRYGDLVGVADISLQVEAGQVVALLGSNGAGKTTTLAAIAGLIAPSRGRIAWRDESISGLPAYAIVGKGLALSPEGWRLFVGQTVEQNLRLGATALADRSRLPALFDRVYALFPRLAERRRQPAGTLSGGERQMLALGRALMSEPRLLMLDEPSLGLAPGLVETLYDTLAQLHRQGLTLLLAEQSIPLALAIADYAYVLQTGRIALEGPAAELERNEQVREIYLGVRTAAGA
jgi:branched-chain amino acid transport system ATP-binding protein